MKIMFLILMGLSILGCVSKDKKTEAPTLTNSEKSVVLNKDISFFTFDAACWQKDGEKSGIYSVLNFTVESVSTDLIGISQKEKRDFIPTTCFLEAKEKVIEVGFKPEVIDFECFFKDNLVVGSEYNFVENLSQTMVWLISLKDGQNIVIPKNLCMIYPHQKK